MNKKTAIVVLSALIIAQLAFGQASQDRLHYISKYVKIAQDEMERTGVPASIKLAQAILESNGGKSVLSRKANNHFGIKCGGDWNARSYYRVDDEKDAKGNPIESCFRAYKNPESSFIAHSEFLRDNQRYSFLFDLEHTDFHGWAHGLKKAGYATNPSYPKLLIKIINDYELFQYDILPSPFEGDMLATEDEDFILEQLAQIEGKSNTRPSNTRSSNTRKSKKFSFGGSSSQKQGFVQKLNDISVVYAKQGDTPEIIAIKSEVPLKRILKYNEGLVDGIQEIPDGTPIFLQPKRAAFRGRKKFHQVSEGETIALISQRYGIRIDKLQDRNRLEVNEEPLSGAILKIRGGRVPSNMQIPTREAYAIGIPSKKQEAKNMEKYATSLSDFEDPPSQVQKRQEANEKQGGFKFFNFGKKKKASIAQSRDRTLPSDSYTASPTYEQEPVETIKKRPEVYSAPSSDTYSNTTASSNAKFKEEKTTSIATPSTKVYDRPVIKETTVLPGTLAEPNASNNKTSVTSTASNSTVGTSSAQHTNSTPSYTVIKETKPAGTISVPTTTETNSTTITTSTTPMVVTTPQISTKYHTVLKGETLYRLSKMYGKSVDYIKQVNGLNSNTISIGQKLIVN